MKKKLSKSDKVFYTINGIILGLLALIVIYPLYFIIIASLSSPDAIFNGEVFLYPKSFDLSGYTRMFNEPKIWTGYKNTIIYTLIGTTINIAFTIPAGWALSRKNLPFKKFFMWTFIITMFFGGGLIPFYILLSRLNMVGKPIAIILPSAVSVWNMFMTKAYYESSIAEEMVESPQIDGAGHIRTFLFIILPLSKPIIAVMLLFYAVGHWNSYFAAMIFLSKESQYPLQLILMEILVQVEASSSTGDATTILEQAKLANQIKYSSIIISSLPIIAVYPFVQKFFSKGIMIGSLK